jgi:acylphosphatase
MKTYKLALSGRVQGVGMRFFVNRTASRLGLKGYVKNVYDGTVEVVVQGEDDVINVFLKDVDRNSPGTIDNVVKSDVYDSRIFTKFSVKIF